MEQRMIGGLETAVCIVHTFVDAKTRSISINTNRQTRFYEEISKCVYRERVVVNVLLVSTR